MPYKGYKQTDEHKKKKANLSSVKGVKKGKMTDEHKRKISVSNIGKLHVYKSEETRTKSLSNLRNDNWVGKKRPEISGENHYLYNPNRPICSKLRSCIKYRQWRSDVFERDNYTCQFCGDRGGRIEADHIKAFSLILIENKVNTLDGGLECEELWNINNGRTLCKDCHKTTDNYLLKARYYYI